MTDLGSAPPVERATPPVEKKWEVAFLFDASEEDAEDLLVALFDLANEINDTSAGSLTEVVDLEAWVNCRCGVRAERDSAERTP